VLYGRGTIDDGSKSREGSMAKKVCPSAVVGPGAYQYYHRGGSIVVLKEGEEEDEPAGPPAFPPKRSTPRPASSLLLPPALLPVLSTLPQLVTVLPSQKRASDHSLAGLECSAHPSEEGRIASVREGRWKREGREAVENAVGGTFCVERWSGRDRCQLC
jgi:hypothetical protein